MSLFAEHHKHLGQPFYTYRSTLESNGITSYRAQLIFKGESFTTDKYYISKEAAANEAARMALETLLPQELESISPLATSSLSALHNNLNLPQKRNRSRYKFVESENDADITYKSDSDDDFSRLCPTYENLLAEFLARHQCNPPTYIYTKWQHGYKCTATFSLFGSGESHTLTTLREHLRKSHAKEDVSKDLFLIAQQVVNR